MDISTIASVLTSIKTATDLVNFLRDSSTSLEKAEINLKLAEIINALADAKINIADIKQILIDKDEQIRKLKGQLEIKDKIVWDDPCYWLIDGEKKDGPFCQQCYDRDHQLVRLQEFGSAKGRWKCLTCRNVYLDAQARSEVVDTRIRTRTRRTY
jgi:hypothetical protein